MPISANGYVNSALLEQPNLKKVGDDDFEKGIVNGVELALKRITSDCSATCEQLFKISDDWSSEQASKIIDFVVCNLENGGPLPTTTLACNMLDYMVESFYTFLNKNLHVLQDFYICVTRLLDEASPNKECARLTRSLEVLYNGDNERSPDQQMTIEGLFDITGRTYSFELVGEKVTINVHGSPPTVAPEYQPFNEEAEWKNGPAGHLVKQLRDSTTMNMTHTSETAAYATLTAMIDSGNVFNGFNLRLLIQVFFEKGPVFDGTDTNGQSNRLTQLLDRLRSRAETSTFKVRRDIEDLRIILGRDDKVVEEAALMNIEAGERLVDIEETLEDGMARLGCAD